MYFERTCFELFRRSQGFVTFRADSRKKRNRLITRRGIPVGFANEFTLNRPNINKRRTEGAFSQSAGTDSGCEWRGMQKALVVRANSKFALPFGGEKKWKPVYPKDIRLRPRKAVAESISATTALAPMASDLRPSVPRAGFRSCAKYRFSLGFSPIPLQANQIDPMLSAGVKAHWSGLDSPTKMRNDIGVTAIVNTWAGTYSVAASNPSEVVRSQ